MTVAPSSQQFVGTCLGNTSTKGCIAIQLAVEEHRDRVHWNPPVAGNRMVWVPKHLHGYRGHQDGNGRYLRGQMSARVGKGLIGVRPSRGIDWYRPRSVRIPVAPSSQQFESTCPGNSSTKVCIAIQPAVGQHRDRVRCNPPDSGNRMV